MPIRMLIYLKQTTKKEPYKIFDIISGTSTGGNLALFLEVLKIKVDSLLKVKDLQFVRNLRKLRKRYLSY